jgi:D-glycero-D-manno-heptose 1,7-bisphosphate phosphatase
LALSRLAPGPAVASDEVVTRLPSRAVFLDRDGVLVVPEFRDGRSFAPTSLADFRIYDDAVAATATMKAAGYQLIVVTNQPDVGYGRVTLADVDEMHRRLNVALPLDAIEACYHRHVDACNCRKPKPGMLLRAGERLGIDYAQSFMVGDRASDIAAGKAVGCRTIFIDLNYVDEPSDGADFVVRSLSEAAAIVAGRAGKSI